MRGDDNQLKRECFSYISPEKRVPAKDHPFATDPQDGR